MILKDATMFMKHKKGYKRFSFVIDVKCFLKCGTYIINGRFNSKKFKIR